MNKIKSFIDSEEGKNILTVVILILVGLSSFGLGRLSKLNNSGGLKIEYAKPLEANVASAPLVPTPKSKPAITTTVTPKKPLVPVTAKTFFASNRGSKYYSIGCGGGKTIKQENRIYFATEEEAEKAGYELSVSCK